MKTPELNPCPCCGGKAAFAGGESHARVECQNCSLQTGTYLRSHAFSQLEYVAAIWNKAADGPVAIAAKVQAAVNSFPIPNISAATRREYYKSGARHMAAHIATALKKA
jgi:hypothetical protein